MKKHESLKALSSRQPSDSAAVWLGRILDAVPDDAEMDDELLDQIVRRVNGSLADEQRHIEEDPEAYLAFWHRMADRLPSHPFARATYADTLLLTGDTQEALDEILAAFRADPRLIYRMSGEYRDLLERAGGAEWAAYRALAIRAAELDDPTLHEDYIRDEVKQLIADVGDDPALRRLVLGILKP
jgi:predicted Zn-dependent protease